MTRSRRFQDGRRAELGFMTTNSVEDVVALVEGEGTLSAKRDRPISRDKRRFFAVLHVGAIRSPADAVRAAIVAEVRHGGAAMKWSCVAVALLASSPAALADQTNFTGNQLQVLCADENSALLCSTYISGFFYGAYAQKVLNEPMCFPQGVTSLQAVQVVKKYLREKPENLHDDAWMAVAVALSAAFPCKRSN